MSKRHFLEFEQPIAELDAKIEELSKTATITREGEGIDPTILKNSALID